MANQTRWIKTISINLIGELTGEQYVGDFDIKTLLSYDEQLSEDRLRRELLSGPEQITSSSNALSISAVFSYLGARVVKSPTWWTENRNGMALYDNNIVAAVYDRAMEITAAQLKELKDRAEASRKALSETKPLTDTNA